MNWKKLEEIKKNIDEEYANRLDDEEVKIYHVWESNLENYFQPEIMKKLKEDSRLYQPYILYESFI